MKPMLLTILLAFTYLPKSVIPHSANIDTPVEFKDLPAATAKTIQVIVGNAKIISLVLATDETPYVFEAIWFDGQHHRAISVAADGSIVTEEKSLTSAETPEVIQKAIKQEAASNPVTAVLSLLEKQQQSYNVAITKRCQTVTAKFDATGKVTRRSTE